MSPGVVLLASLIAGGLGLARLSRGEDRLSRLATPLLFGALVLWVWQVVCVGFAVPGVLLPPP